MSTLTSDELAVDPAVALRLAGKRYPEIAAALGIHRATARLRVERAVRRGLVSAQAARYRARPGMSDEEYDRRWLERLRARTVAAESGCYIWQGPVGSKGYIMLPHREWQNSGHRIVYRILRKKDLATSDLVCHECDTRRCWNIDHLFIGTEAVNNRDCGNKGRHHNSVKTHCKRGHEFTPENTYLKYAPGTVMRACLECQRIRFASPKYVAWRKQYAKERRAKLKAKKREQHYV